MHGYSIVPKKDIPLTWEDQVIGTGTMREDGVFEYTLNDSEAAERVRKAILGDTLDHLSVDVWEDTTDEVVNNLLEPQVQNVFDKED